MVRKFLKISLILSLVLGLSLSLAYQAGLLSPNTNLPVLDSRYPATDGVDEMIVNGMPVPGTSGVEESIVGSQMPVPGLEGVDEMIVEE